MVNAPLAPVSNSRNVNPYLQFSNAVLLDGVFFCARIAKGNTGFCFGYARAACGFRAYAFAVRLLRYAQYASPARLFRCAQYALPPGYFAALNTPCFRLRRAAASPTRIARSDFLLSPSQDETDRRNPLHATAPAFPFPRTIKRRSRRIRTATIS